MLTMSDMQIKIMTSFSPENISSAPDLDIAQDMEFLKNRNTAIFSPLTFKRILGFHVLRKYILCV